jgi:hypothetical protein
MTGHKWWKAPIAEVANEDGSKSIQVVSRGTPLFLPGMIAHVPKWMDIPWALVRTPEAISGIRDWQPLDSANFKAEFETIFGRAPSSGEGP